MKTNRRVEIEVETLRLRVRRGAGGLLRCPLCDSEIAFAGESQQQPAIRNGAALSQPEADSLRLLEAAQVAHYACPNSPPGAVEPARGNNTDATRDAGPSPAATHDLPKE